MMLLIGMKISFTKKPMKPMIAKPTDVACAIFENSAAGGAHGAGQHWHCRPTAGRASSPLALLDTTPVPW